MNKEVFYNLLTPILIILLTVFVILFSRGWRIDLDNGQIVNTGILDISTDPRGATIRIDGEEKGKSPKVIDSLKAGQYTLELEKEGSILWTKEITIVESKVTKVEANLFATETALEQVNDFPIKEAIFAPTGDKAIFVSHLGGNQGIWLYTLKQSFFFNPGQIKITNLYEPELFDLLKSEYKILPSKDLSKLLLEVTESDATKKVFYYAIDSFGNVARTDLSDKLYNLTTPIWSDDQGYIIWKENNTVFSLNLDTLQKVVIIENVENYPFDSGLGKIYITGENVAGKLNVTYYNTNGTDEKTIEFGIKESAEVFDLKVNSRYQMLLVSTSAGTYVYDLEKKTTKTISDSALIRNSESPNDRFILLQDRASADSNSFTVYDYEDEVLLDGFTLENNEISELYWSPNDLKLFYRYTTEDKTHILKAIDTDGGNPVEILKLTNYEAPLDNLVGFDSEGKILYVPLLSGTVTNTNETDEGNPVVETETSQEVFLFQIQLRK